MQSAPCLIQISTVSGLATAWSRTVSTNPSSGKFKMDDMYIGASPSPCSMRVRWKAA